MKEKNSFLKKIVNKIFKSKNKEENDKTIINVVLKPSKNESAKTNKVEYILQKGENVSNKEEKKEPEITVNTTMVNSHDVEKYTERYKNGDYEIKYIIDNEIVAVQEEREGIIKKKIEKIPLKIEIEKNKNGENVGFGKYVRYPKLHSYVESIEDNTKTGEKTVIAEAPLVNSIEDKIGQYEIIEKSKIENGIEKEYEKNKKVVLNTKDGKIAKIEENTINKEENYKYEKYYNDKKVLEISKEKDKVVIIEYLSGNACKTYLYLKNEINNVNKFHNFESIPEEGEERYSEFKNIIHSVGIPSKVLNELKMAKKYTPNKVNELIKQANKQYKEKEEER